MVKKVFCFVVLLAVCLCVLPGCDGNSVKPNTSENLCRVLCLVEDDIVVWTESVGNIYVKNVNAAGEIQWLDTVVIEFAQSDLEAANGEFTDYFGEKGTYSYILETVRGIRFTNPGEPTFG